MRAGALDRRIELVRYVSGGTDEYGQPVNTRTVMATVWASVKQQAGREFLTDGNIPLAEERTVFTIRHRPDVLVTDILVWEGREFDAKFVRELGRRRGLEIQAIARA